MGVVYRARQTRLNRVVALKMVLTGASAGPEGLARFRAEAQAIARLDHPNIVRVYEAGEHRGLPYFSMDLVEDGSLKDLLAARPLPARDSARVVEALARAAHHAHQHGIIHRDLKPANVLWKAGLPLLADFGLAKRLDRETGLTASGAVLGTVAYMAPEQADGKAGTVGPRTDVYGLGAVLYELLSGRPPVQGETWLEALAQLLHGEPPPPSRLRPDVPGELEAVCLRCLEKDPARRYPSAEALADDLARFLDGEPPAAQALAEWDRHERWAPHVGYEILELLDCGWAGFLYKARQSRLNRLVALKVLASWDQAGRTELARFHREAEAMARLQHPNVVQVFDFGEYRGLPYFSMEFLGGGNLIGLFAAGPPPPRQAARLVEPLARAVHHAHQQGVVHGDLKPGNVLLTTTGTPKVASFAVASRLGGGWAAAKGRSPFGRLASYQAPEQVEGRLDRVGPATDVYGLGATLYWLLTGRPPFLGETLEQTREMVRSGGPVPPSHLRPGVPAGLEAVCLRCLERDPGRRYPSAEALGDDLARWLAQGGEAGS
jgi:serine/threonine protein kinase